MNTKNLVYIDAVFSILIHVVASIFRLRNKCLKKFQKSAKKEKILVIKFLGAGNFLAIADVLEALDCTIITVESNVNSIKKFISKANIIVINEKNTFTLLKTIILASTKLIGNRYSKVVNLEAESSFAKLITTIPISYEVTGLSNNYKSILDEFYYDYYLVSPINLNRNRVLTLLLGIESPKENKINSGLLEKINESILIEKKYINKNKVVVAPTCSLTDRNRRLSIDTWEDILLNISNIYLEVEVLFPSNRDQQYKEFLIIVAKMKIDNIKISISHYDEFVIKIMDSDLVITIDSQALHIGQYFNKFIICFYGPTSPHGVRLNNRTYSISKEMECSPCTHKYFREPCNGEIYCMKYNRNNINSILNKILC